MLVQNLGNFVRHIGVRLIPGVNNLSLSEGQKFKKALEHPLNKYLIDKGEIVIAQDDDFASLASLDAKKAIELVNDTFELATLQQFREEEAAKGNRKTVIEAIDKQIESIKNPPEDKIVKPEE